MKAAATDLPGFQASSASGFSAAARAGGAVICLGYLLGLAEGSVVAVVGGLALITFGRNLLLDHRSAALSGAALAVIAASLGIAALRWGALDLSELRGVQSVLGPTVLVGPAAAAAATALAAVAALAGLTVWMARPWPGTKVMMAWWALEAAIGSGALVALFFHPAGLLGRSSASVPAVLATLAAAALLTGTVAGAGFLLQKIPDTVTAVLMLGSGGAVAAAAGILVTSL